MASLAPDYYFILGVNQDASKKTLTRAYLDLTKPTSPTTLHVRRNDDDSDDEALTPRQIEVQKAYKFLADDKNRAVYDTTYPQLRESWDAERLSRARRRASSAKGHKQIVAKGISQKRAQAAVVDARARRNTKLARRLAREKFALEAEQDLNDHSLDFHDLETRFFPTQEYINCRSKELAREEKDLMEGLRRAKLRLAKIQEEQQEIAAISTGVRKRLVAMATENEVLANQVADRWDKLDGEKLDFD
ncbi:hypothetical protein GGR57DRAFT_519766 [Xylariaceae sp. FL1272]|nr:hypothetical protein GGR57DRAFT_519766 [Xylariaceae sp. FL1272]